MDTPHQGGSYSFLLESWLEFAEAIESHPEIRSLLFDSVTGLPTTPLLFPRIKALLQERNEVSLLCVNVVRYSKIEEIYGWKVFDDVMRHVAHALQSITGTVVRDADIIAEVMISGNAFVVVLSPPRASLRMEADARQLVVARVEESIKEILEVAVEPDIYRKFGCYVGAATITHDSNTRLERLVHAGLDAALHDSATREAVDAETRKRRLKEIIEAEDVRTLVHPIFDLTDMSIIGYEALSRGPEKSEFERPDKLFKVAYDSDLVMHLERICRKKAIQAAAGLPEGRKMFINIEPDAVSDPELREVMSNTLLVRSLITPDRIVLELTERTAVQDFLAFRATLEYLRALGFSIAVDDAGAGYGSLQCLAEVRPEWLKVDISLIRGCDSDEVRCSLIHSLVQFSETMGVSLIAEGIETVAELHQVRRLGVRYGQGFLFSLPCPPFPDDAIFDGLKEL